MPLDTAPADTTNRLLRVIIALMLRGHENETLTLRQQVEILSGLGLKPVEIAGVLGRSGTYVNKELSGIRKQNGKKK